MVEERGSKQGGEEAVFWSWQDVEERFVEATKFWWRVEAGAWPFAGDGPWHLIRRDEGAAAAAEEILNAAAEGRAATPSPRPVPLSLEEIARRDETTEWYLIVAERDRQLVQVAVAQLAAGSSRISWTKVRRRMRVENGTRALGMRYSRALTAVAQALTRRKVPTGGPKMAESRAGNVSSPVI